MIFDDLVKLADKDELIVEVLGYYDDLTAEEGAAVLKSMENLFSVEPEMTDEMLIGFKTDLGTYSTVDVFLLHELPDITGVVPQGWEKLNGFEIDDLYDQVTEELYPPSEELITAEALSCIWGARVFPENVRKTGGIVPFVGRVFALIVYDYRELEDSVYYLPSDRMEEKDEIKKFIAYSDAVTGIHEREMKRQPKNDASGKQ